MGSPWTEESRTKDTSEYSWGMSPHAYVSSSCPELLEREDSLGPRFSSTVGTLSDTQKSIMEGGSGLRPPSPFPLQMPQSDSFRRCWLLGCALRLCFQGTPASVGCKQVEEQCNMTTAAVRNPCPSASPCLPAAGPYSWSGRSARAP